ncbi:MAG: tRNA (guanine(10)-N(2))-dimethyltransferase [Candidatus Micrarchaeota archaeon]
MSAIKEGKAQILLKEGVFFNPKMELCRDVSSLAVGAYGGKNIALLDGFCASGVRGIRYKLENANIGKVTLVDLSRKACALARKNVRANKLKDAEVKFSEINKFLIGTGFELIELDPFGSPAPHIYDALRSIARNGGGALSATATDMAVLCGAHFKACVKNYNARPLDNEFCHENAARILLGFIARNAAQFNLGMEVCFTFSDLHYLKVFVKLERGAEKADETMKKLGYIVFCPSCLERVLGSVSEIPRGKCLCGGSWEFAGPLWLGNLWEKKFVEKMIKLNVKRRYANKEKIDSLLKTIEGELDLPATYYDVHKLCKRLKTSPPSMKSLLEKLRAKRVKTAKTHFANNCVRMEEGKLEILKKILVEANV